MTETVVLKATNRDMTDMSQIAKELRVLKRVPLVCYGHNRENIHASVDHEQLRKVFIKAGSNTLVDLDVDGKKEKILIKEVQRHPVSGDFMHIDCYIVKLKEKITTEIPLEFVGVSNAVKNFAGLLITSLDEISVKCLPTDLVHSIEVDISKLENFGDAIHISDLIIPHGMEVLDDMELVICTVQEPVAEEVDEVVAEEVSPADVPTTEQGPEEEADKTPE